MKTNHLQILRGTVKGISGRKLAKQYRSNASGLLREAKLHCLKLAEDLDGLSTEENLANLLSVASGSSSKTCFCENRALWTSS